MSDTSNGDGEVTLGNQYLQGIPEEDRPVVEKYISEWDKQVTQKFQSIHDEYRPYKNLNADPDTVTKAWEMFNYINDHPQEFYTYLGEALKEMSDEQTPPPAASAPPASVTQESLYENLPPEFVQAFTKQSEMLEGVAKWVADEQASRQRAQEDKVLEDYLGKLHTEHGDFDEDYVLAKMYRGTSAEDAINAFKTLTNTAVNTAVNNQAKVPPFLSSGSVPTTTFDPAKATRDEAKQAFVAMLRATAEANQAG